MVEVTHQTTPNEGGEIHGSFQKLSNTKECLSCRVMGAGVLAGTGSYAIWQSRAAAPGTPLQKKVVAGLGLALIVGSVFRWRQWKCKEFFLASIQKSLNQDGI